MMLSGERSAGVQGIEDDEGELAASAACCAWVAFARPGIGLAGARLGVVRVTWRPVRRPSDAA